MFCFGLQSIARFINTDAFYLNIHRLEAEVKFSRNFKCQKEKNKNVIHRPWSIRIGRNGALGLSTSLGLRPWVVLKTSGSFSQCGSTKAGE